MLVKNGSGDGVRASMIGCGFSEAISGDVIRWHVVAIFAPSFLPGS